MRLIGNILIFVFVVGTLYVLKDDIAPLIKNFGSEANKVAQTVIPQLPTAKLFDKNTTKNDEPGEDTTGADQPTELHLATKESVTPLKPIATKKNTQTPDPLPIQNSGNINGPLTIANVVAATNYERTSRGLSALTISNELNHSAEEKVNDMFAKQYFEHVSPSGVTLDQLIAKTGYQFVIIGENLAYGNFTTAEDVVTAWMNSPGHRANILNKEYSEIGIGVRLGTYKGREVWMLAQHFGLPINVCPLIDQKLKVDVQASTAALDTLAAEITEKKKQIDASSGYTYEDEQRVAEYNEMVNRYNELVTKVKVKIAQYNAMISAYNECIKSHTGAD
jgi:uncharacterized protein YkwD